MMSCPLMSSSSSAYALKKDKRDSWCTMPSAPPDDSAPSASLGRLKAQAAPTHPGAKPEHLGGLPWPPERGSRRPKVEDCALSTARLNLSGLLNVLDGCVDAPNRIVIMTTNHPEKLDPALTRPGRINKHILMGYLLPEHALSMVEHYFGPTSAEWRAKFFAKFTPESSKGSSWDRLGLDGGPRFLSLGICFCLCGLTFLPVGRPHHFLAPFFIHF